MQNILLAGGPNAEVTNPLFSSSLQAQTGQSFIQTFIPRLITLAIIVGVIIFFFVLIFGAIKWITSGGDKQALESARGRITSAIVGIAILFVVFAIMSLIQRFFGISILTLDIGSLVIQ